MYAWGTKYMVPLPRTDGGIKPWGNCIAQTVVCCRASTAYSLAADRTGRTWGSGWVIRSRAATTQGWFAAAPLVCVVAMRFEIVEGVRACKRIIVIWRDWFPKLGCNRTGLNPIEMCYQKIMTWLIPIEMLLTAGLNGNEGLKTIGGIEQNGELDLFAGHQNSSHPAPMSVSSPRSKLFWFSF